ncbi:P-loop containing nucleoside triphosphate hydrolase protein [Trametes versicolor FP-101664 SS1]|uniref:P-loop containing nucleoside triphosphate hydrolase protein n=1 Tax=Trametes versicolor (strain FP-101664) TaxID=717944 RepID=UPI00046221B8|nr:P-loop containing nucleoside triphosphate hydrolase protein [Trametes versicolor FP-101664 SS1]EIW53171.1 P-loop containing nucleoside triphosphate hydrolase protein [Trametes versicolor FP-101664 SS1]
MRRFLSRSRSSSSHSADAASEKWGSHVFNPPQRFNRQGEPIIYEDTEDDEQSTAALVSAPADAPPPPANFKIKRVDNYYSSWSKAWKFRNTGSSFNPEALITVGNGARDGNDPWQSYCFVVVRKLPKPSDDGGEPTYQVVVKSPYLLKACKDVIQKVQGVSWTAEPLELDPHLLLAFLPQFEQYRDGLRAKSNRTSEETTVMKTVDVLIDYLRTDYKGTIAKVANLTAHGEITFDTLFALFVPRSIVVSECPTTGEPRAFQIVSASKIKSTIVGGMYDLICESVDAFDDANESGSYGAYGAASFNPAAGPNGGFMPYIPTPPGMNPEDAEMQRAAGKSFGRVQNRIFVSHFKGTMKISSLDVYPIIYHPDAGRLEMSLIARGKKWLELRGIHHMQYDGPAGYTLSMGGTKSTIKYRVKSRIMIDKGNFRRLNPNYEMPMVKVDNAPPPNVPDQYGNYPPSPPPIPYNPNSTVPTFQVRARATRDVDELTEDELMLTPPSVYGFSLTDKTWLEFNIQHVQPIVWNDEAFANLVLPADRKILLQSLVEAHNGDLSFDDFVANKGRGLVINLFGPPGVGKTLSAEATSEHVRQPLYVVGAGDLGTSAIELDQALNRVFDIATSWRAIVLIDEADVFLEQRSLHDMERNAMVAVFLRHVEYYHGILFMTTNRVKAFDEAFLSRIHVALHFHDLTRDARKQVWAAFLSKVGVAPAQFGEALLDKLAEREVNGRQIKNAVRTASSLAAKKGVQVSYADLMETLDAVDEFTAEFRAVRQVDA